MTKQQLINEISTILTRGLQNRNNTQNNKTKIVHQLGGLLARSVRNSANQNTKNRQTKIHEKYMRFLLGANVSKNTVKNILNELTIEDLHRMLQHMKQFFYEKTNHTFKKKKRTTKRKTLKRDT